jgi:glycosyltransferase involved in cell wall biosynthesis
LGDVRLNILVFTFSSYPDNYGGVSKVIYEISKRLCQKGHNLSILTRRKERSFPEHEVIEGINFYRFNAPFKREISKYTLASRYMLPEFIRLCKGIRFDLIHIHDIIMAPVLCLSEFGRKIPWVVTFHAPTFKEIEVQHLTAVSDGRGPSLKKYVEVSALSGLVKLLNSYSLHKADKVISLSEYNNQLLKKYFDIDQNKVFLIPGGVDLETYKYTEDKQRAKTSLGLPKNRFILLTIRRLEPRMGIQNLIKAIPKVRRFFPEILLVIGGTGSIRNELEELTKELKVTEHVLFKGYLSEALKSTFYQAADLFIMPTLRLEGFGLSTIEALASGTPVLATPVGNNKKIIGELNPGFLFKDTGPAAMADLIIEMIRQKSELKKIGLDCYRFVLKNYSWDKSAEMTEKLFKEVVSNGIH